MTGEDHIAFHGVLLATDGSSDANLVARAAEEIVGLAEEIGVGV